MVEVRAECRTHLANDRLLHGCRSVGHRITSGSGRIFEVLTCQLLSLASLIRIFVVLLLKILRSVRDAVHRAGGHR